MPTSGNTWEDRSKKSSQWVRCYHRTHCDVRLRKNYFLTDSIRTCVTETVNMGGDADTAGALAGMLAGATYGAATLPDGWLLRLDPAIGKEIAAQIPQLLAIADGRAAAE